MSFLLVLVCGGYVFIICCACVGSTDSSSYPGAKQYGFFAGIQKLRFKPAYNPYTEPSMEIFR